MFVWRIRLANTHTRIPVRRSCMAQHAMWREVLREGVAALQCTRLSRLDYNWDILLPSSVSPRRAAHREELTASA